MKKAVFRNLVHEISKELNRPLTTKELNFVNWIVNQNEKEKKLISQNER